MEEAFIEACFEEMLQEEEDRWFHNHVATTVLTVYYASPSFEQKLPTVSCTSFQTSKFIHISQSQWNSYVQVYIAFISIYF